MSSFRDFRAEVESIVASKLSLGTPATGKVNVLTTIQATKRSFIEEINDGRIQLPCAVIEIGNFSPVTGFDPSDWRTKRAPVRVFYCNAYGPGSTEVEAIDKAFALVNWIDNPQNDFTTFNPIETASVLGGLDDPINDRILAATGADIISAVVSWDAGWMIRLG